MGSGRELRVGSTRVGTACEGWTAAWRQEGEGWIVQAQRCACHSARLLQVRGSWGSGQDPASHIPPLVSDGETFARLGLPSGPSELMSELQWPIFPSAHTPAPLPLLFSLLSAFFFFFCLFFPIIMRDICLQTASEISSAPAQLPLLLSPISFSFVAPRLSGGCDIAVPARGPHPR